MKDGARQVLGKTISGVVITEGDGRPRSQLFLLFDDGTYYEFYSNSGAFSTTGGLSSGTLENVMSLGIDNVFHGLETGHPQLAQAFPQKSSGAFA